MRKVDLQAFTYVLVLGETHLYHNKRNLQDKPRCKLNLDSLTH